MRAAFLAAPLLAALLATPVAAAGQTTEFVSWTNPQDGMPLSGQLSMPAGPGPFGGVVLLTLAGSDPLVARLNAQGLAVLRPERRGMVAVEVMLRASFDVLSADVQSAVDFLRARPDVGDDAVSLVAQGEDTPAALIAAARAPITLALLSPPGFDGTETFRQEQTGTAELRGAGRFTLDSLDLWIEGLARTARSDDDPLVRDLMIQAFMTEEGMLLPRSANFPLTMEGQAHFFASQWWWDRFTFDPIPLYGRLRGPVLVLIGLEDPFTPFDRYFPAIRNALGRAAGGDAELCAVRGRARHEFTEEVSGMLAAWIGRRAAAPGRTLESSADAIVREACIEDPTGLR